jgi:hypothetical protein
MVKNSARTGGSGATTARSAKGEARGNSAAGAPEAPVRLSDDATTLASVRCSDGLTGRGVVVERGLVSPCAQMRGVFGSCEEQSRSSQCEIVRLLCGSIAGHEHRRLTCWSPDPMLRCRLAKIRCGEVREWSNRHAWKACVPAMGPWVRIPPSPPYQGKVKIKRQKFQSCVFPNFFLFTCSFEVRGWALCNRTL